MKRSEALRAASGVALACLAVGAVTALARADEPPYVPGAAASARAAVASASASALASSEIAPPPSSARGAWDPDFTAPPVPDEPSKPPALAEWAKAPEAKEARVTEPDCEVQRIREWYRVTCKFAQAFELAAGSAKDVTVDCHHETSEDFCESSYAIFPMRRGDVRSFDVFVWSRWGPEADSLVSAQYLDGDALPLVSVHGIRWGF